MKISVPLENGLLPDRFGKFAPAEFQVNGHCCRSFPITIEEIPQGTQSLALAFLDYDAIPVGGFCWIHWLACNFEPCAQIPENASLSGEMPCVQGANSSWSPMIGGSLNAPDAQGYVGPRPPDQTHFYTLYMFALDSMLELRPGYFLNEFRRALYGHVLDWAEIDIPSRAN